MSEERMKSAWALLCFRVKPHIEQTGRFALPLSGFTKKQLVRMSPVMPQTISAMRYFLPMLPPKNQPEIRRQLAYLTELRDLQAEAWADAIGRAEADAQNHRERLRKTIQAWA